MKCLLRKRQLNIPCLINVLVCFILFLVLHISMFKKFSYVLNFLKSLFHFVSAMFVETTF